MPFFKSIFCLKNLCLIAIKQHIKNKDLQITDGKGGKKILVQIKPQKQQEIPPLLIDVLIHTHVITDVVPKYVENLQDWLEAPSIIAGGYAAAKCNLTNTYGDIDIFTIADIKTVKEICANPEFPLHQWFNNRNEFNRDYFKSLPDGTKYLVVKYSEPQSETAIDMVFIIEENKEALKGLFSNMGNMVQHITSRFDIEICKSIGFKVMPGTYIFTCLGDISNNPFTDYCYRKFEECFIRPVAGFSMIRFSYQVDWTCLEDTILGKMMKHKTGLTMGQLKDQCNRKRASSLSFKARHDCEAQLDLNIKIWLCLNRYQKYHNRAHGITYDSTCHNVERIVGMLNLKKEELS